MMMMRLLLLLLLLGGYRRSFLFKNLPNFPHVIYFFFFFLSIHLLLLLFYLEPWEKNPCFIVAGCRDMTAGWDIPRQRLTTAAVNWPPWASRRLVIHVLKRQSSTQIRSWESVASREEEEEETRSSPSGPALNTIALVMPPTMTDEWGNELRQSCWRRRLNEGQRPKDVWCLRSRALFLLLLAISSSTDSINYSNNIIILNTKYKRERKENKTKQKKKLRKKMISSAQKRHCVLCCAVHTDDVAPWIGWLLVVTI